MIPISDVRFLRKARWGFMYTIFDVRANGNDLENPELLEFETKRKKAGCVKHPALRCRTN